MKWFTNLSATYKALLIVAVILVFVIIGVVIYNKRKKKKETETAVQTPVKPLTVTYNANASGGGANAAPVSSLTAAYAALPDGDFPIQKGSKNKLVWLLQYYMNVIGGQSLTLDGNFGTLTENATKAVFGNGVVQITKSIAIAAIQGVPTNKVALFADYSDLIQAKILN